MGHYPVVTVAAAAILGLAAAELMGFLPIAGGLLLLLIGLLWRPGDRAGHALFALVLLCALYGQYRYWRVPVDDVGHFAGHTVRLTATVAELPHVETGRAVFLARARRVGIGDREVAVSGTVRVARYLDEGTRVPAYGDRLTARVTLRPITSLMNPGGFDYRAWMWRRGVRVRASIAAGAEVAWERGPPGLLASVNHWRERMGAAARAALSPDAAALLTALAAGDARGVPQAVRDRFQAAGVAHLLAVSGTHLGLVAGVVFLLLRAAAAALPIRLLRPLTARVSLRQAAAAGALVAVTGYAFLAGGRIPTLRALVMVWLVTLALASGRRSHPPTALALAALAILAWDPRALGAAAFQLSFAAVLAILLTLERWGPPVALDGGPPSLAVRVGHALGTTVLITLAAGLAAAPLAAWYFGYVSWIGFLANLVLVPLAGFAVLPLCVVLAVLAPAVGGLPLPGLLEGLLSGFLGLVGWFARVPGAGAAVAAPPLALVFATYGAGVVLLLWWGDAARRAVALGAATFGAAWLLCLHPPAPTGLLRVAFLDVGQGDAAVAVGPQGDALVIDGGTRFGGFDTGRLAVAPYLARIGVRRPALLATHPQLDHAGGLIYLIDTLRPRVVYTNGIRRPDRVFDRDFHAALARTGLSPSVLSRGAPFAPLAGVACAVLNPPAGVTATGGHALNDSSVVVRLALGRDAFLFTGDAEAPAEAAMLAAGADLSATVLKVPHHGATTSSTAPFLDRVDPKVAVVSAGAFNPFGHPDPAVVAALRAHGADVRTTPGDGAVLFESDGRTLRMAAWRDLAPARVAPWDPAPAAAERRNLVRLASPGRLWRTVPDGRGPA